MASLAVVVISLVGCQTPAPSSAPAELTLLVADRDVLIDRALTVLRESGFDPDAVDRDNGLIITKRATSGQWFEFWRPDSRGAYQVLESSLHTMGRVVTVALTSVEHGDTAEAPATAATTAAAAPATRPAAGWCRLRVRVDKSRYNAPARQVTTASGALAIYGEELPTEEGVRRAHTPDAHWVSLGEDGLLAEYLLGRIALGARPPAGATP